MVCIGARGKTYSSLCQPVWISDQAAEPLKDFFTSILSEEDCFLCCIQDFLTVRFLVRGQVLHEPGDKASTGEILPLPFFFFVSELLVFNWKFLGGCVHGGQGAVPDLGCGPKLTEAQKNR